MGCVARAYHSALEDSSLFYMTRISARSRSPGDRLALARAHRGFNADEGHAGMSSSCIRWHKLRLQTRPGPGMPPHSAFSRAHPAPEPAAVAVAASHTGPLSFRRPGPASAPLHQPHRASVTAPIYSSTYYIPVAFRVRLSDGLHFSNLVCLSRAAPPSTVTSTSNKVSQGSH